MSRLSFYLPNITACVLLLAAPIKETVIVDLVDLYVTATDKKGNFITDLRKEEISVTEDGIPQAINSFTSSAGDREEIPMNLVFMIDNSGSMVEEIEGMLKIDLARESGLLLLNELGPLDRMSVITFDENPKITPFTDDKTALEQSIKSVRVHFGYTALFSSISTMLDDLNQQRGRKILVLVSDGNDNLGHTKIDEVIQKMVKSEDLTVVILGTVATYLPQVPYDKIEILNKGKKILQKMADSTAGYAFFPKTLNDVKKVQDLIRSFVRSQYSVAYRPANRKFDGKWRKIKITCSRKNVQLHYRQGYYDTP